MARRGRSDRAPRPLEAAGSGTCVFSSNGRPGTRRGVRTPHSRAAMPVDAYSLAVSCGGRGVSSDIWPASLFGTRRAARRPSSGTTGIAPRPARCVAPRSFCRHADFPALRVSAPCGFLAVGGIAPIRALPRMWRTVPCDASTAYAAALQLGTCSSPCVTPSRRALSSRHVACGDKRDAGHSSTASPRRHQLFSYRNACRHWPGARFCAPSLPDLRASRLATHRGAQLRATTR